jgi:FAD/FMN-containing dehydrogenase
VPGRRRDDLAAIAMTDVNEAVYKMVRERNGSISAEHGIGQAKQAELPHYKSAVEMELMRAVKKTFDPLGIMNPGKVL